HRHGRAGLDPACRRPARLPDLGPGRVRSDPGRLYRNGAGSIPGRAGGDRHWEAPERNLRRAAGQPGDEVPLQVHDDQAGAVELTILGSALLAAALLSALFAVGAGVYGGRTGDRRWVQSARRAVYSMAGLLTLA